MNRKEAFEDARQSADEATQRYFGMSASDMGARIKRQEEQIAALKADNFKLKIDVELLRAACDRFSETNKQLRKFV